MPRFLTVEEAAEMLGLSPRTIRRRLADGSLRKADLKGRAVRIPASELLRLAYGEPVQPSHEEPDSGGCGDGGRGADAAANHPDKSGG